MTKLVFFLVAFAYLGLWKTIIYTIATDSLKPGDQLKVYESEIKLCSPITTSMYALYCMDFVGIGGRGYFIVYDSRIDYAVWIANRDEPLVIDVVPETAALTLDHSGVLKITRQSGEPIILYSSAQHKDINNTAATLLDSGNFVLQQSFDYPNGSKSVLWQSFDYPTNTLLPGMKLGVDHKTGKRWSIVSRFLYNVPASGAFSLEWEPERRQLVIRRRDQVYWASGELRDNKFENIPEEVQDMYDYTIDEDTIKFMARNDQYYDPWILSSEGALFASSGKEIARADECYRNNDDRGCLRWDVPTCRDVNEKFDIISARVKYADNLNGSADPAASSTTTDCKDACWRNCDCVGFTNLYDNGTGCYFIYGTWENIQGGSDIFHKLDIKTPTLPKTSTDQKGKPMGWRKWKWIIAVIIIALFMINGCILWLVKKRGKLKLEEKKGTRMEHTILHLENSNGFEDVNNNRDSMKHGHELRLFSYASIMEATNDFSSTNKLGEGGFGPVYKGIIMQKEVAVKRLSRSSRQGVVEFKNELRLVSELQHINLVKLLGCCVHGDERILIYEYMPNKSLDFFLFDSTRSKQLDWKKRLNIIEGIAQGLLYLHKYSRLRIVHRDLKASNILLDEYMNPKISDFGMARISMQESEENTTRIVGTFGYMPPEYAMNGVFSRKSDVYGFGVLMLEIVSGRRNNSFNNTSNPINLVGHAWELWKEGLTLELVDPTINDSVVQDQMLRCIHVGLLCVEECAVDRPTMSEILSMLSNSNEILPSLKKPAFYFGGRVNAINESSKHPKIDSINGMSISDFSAR